ncbi:hypothetical protein DMA11_18875 [Marinilabiliaceae bacterium JC017]|nr:hypothetical protein DMA11_18875 [Marinilabiliaceae bacterium JC017]
MTGLHFWVCFDVNQGQKNAEITPVFANEPPVHVAQRTVYIYIRDVNTLKHHRKKVPRDRKKFSRDRLMLT